MMNKEYVYDYYLYPLYGEWNGQPPPRSEWFQLPAKQVERVLNQDEKLFLQQGCGVYVPYRLVSDDGKGSGWTYERVKDGLGMHIKRTERQLMASGLQRMVMACSWRVHGMSVASSGNVHGMHGMTVLS